MSASTEDATHLQAEVDRLRLQFKNLKADRDMGHISIGNYLLTRLEQLGVKSMFGVPGDFNLGFLDLVEDFPTIDWVGNCNELNAAYAADGYARVNQQSLGVVLTTFGVGELSAINGVAGAFSEMVPVLHIVGAPSTGQQKAKAMLHHTLGDGRYLAYTRASEQFTVAQAALGNTDAAALEIDRVLLECITKARPVYLTLPADLVHSEIPADRLSIPLTRNYPLNDPSVEEYVLDLIVKQVQAADADVIVLVDACTIRHDVRKELNEFIRRTGFPVYAAPMGKTAVDENYPRFGGIYIGSISHPEVKEKVESAKMILSVGALKSDFNTGNFSYNIPPTKTVELHSDHTHVQYAQFPGIGMKRLFPKLTDRLEPFKQAALKLDVPPFSAVPPDDPTPIINHAWLWPTVGSFFRPKDVIVTETGTANFGILDIPLPEKSIILNQILWGSIGWSVGSTLGAALAARESGLGRTILFVGDGSLQLTVQELSVMIRKGLKPIVFVLNNSGYTIEKYIHGKHRHYNNIADWTWTSLLTTLNDGGRVPTKSYKVSTKQEFSQLLQDEKFARADCMQLVEIIMPALDAPRALEVQAEMSGKSNVFSAAAAAGVAQ
ncbi:pyruvate decarboxylase THI3 [Pluteus cervinus]|uniref:Pyruvate decarboxylase THI3 n=1 Tax=Pluteus cervinus TaxID=181527 RepID=A0ACD3B7J3_9AGAR|nr:pyruvate decarboxylase THI3 [Pluteus cervinus]